MILATRRFLGGMNRPSAPGRPSPGAAPAAVGRGGGDGHPTAFLLQMGGAGGQRGAGRGDREPCKDDFRKDLRHYLRAV